MFFIVQFKFFGILLFWPYFMSQINKLTNYFFDLIFFKTSVEFESLFDIDHWAVLAIACMISRKWVFLLSSILISEKHVLCCSS